MQTKLWSTDDKWQSGPDEEPLELFKLDASGTQILPTGVPELVKPVFSLRQCYEDIQRNVKKMNNFLSHGQNEWWAQLFQDVDALFAETEEWYLDGLNQLRADTEIQQNENVESPLLLVSAPPIVMISFFNQSFVASTGCSTQ